MTQECKRLAWLPSYRDDVEEKHAVKKPKCCLTSDVSVKWPQFVIIWRNVKPLNFLSYAVPQSCSLRTLDLTSLEGQSILKTADSIKECSVGRGKTQKSHSVILLVLFSKYCSTPARLSLASTQGCAFCAWLWNGSLEKFIATSPPGAQLTELTDSAFRADLTLITFHMNIWCWEKPFVQSLETPVVTVTIARFYINTLNGKLHHLLPALHHRCPLMIFVYYLV